MYAYFKVSGMIFLPSPAKSGRKLIVNFRTQKLDYHSTECIYAPTAYRGYARALVKDLEAIRPSAIVDLVSLCPQLLPNLLSTSLKFPRLLSSISNC
jgi:hypothetical protein